METNESRAKALAWWRELKHTKKEALVVKHFPMTFFEFVNTSSPRIEKIWRKEQTQTK